VTTRPSASLVVNDKAETGQADAAPKAPLHCGEETPAPGPGPVPTPSPSSSSIRSAVHGSPCVRVCVLQDDVCRGCGRTLDEVVGWAVFDEAEKRAVWERIIDEGYPRYDP